MHSLRYPLHHNWIEQVSLPVTKESTGSACRLLSDSLHTCYMHVVSAQPGSRFENVQRVFREQPPEAIDFRKHMNMGHKSMQFSHG